MESATSFRAETSSGEVVAVWVVREGRGGGEVVVVAVGGA